jgi:hypothetical protein
MEWIRETYNVPAKRGMKVIVQGQEGTIIGSKGQYLRIRKEGEQKALSYHPTWKVKYINDN